MTTTEPPIDPYAGHEFIVVSGNDDKEVVTAIDGYRQVSTYMTVDPARTVWVAVIIAVPHTIADTVTANLQADFDVATSRFNTRKEAETKAATICGFT